MLSPTHINLDYVEGREFMERALVPRSLSKLLPWFVVYVFCSFPVKETLLPIGYILYKQTYNSY
ncbi:hypothetical protein METBIDRAFT_31699 [Metschnikowia bicuspidata var. bicuspidata NRRL YB-4993]|uniref:Uncharacterized protein n=1 Tax=Metschnikowia bicuspidata var. bicuspidata NRRL YB-4993 TaxID=869754 RepID=A0A1A0HB22_9ASCO|nr:hypothetical protein METBIDRAFT_31699 [Metschnikowia bicuspidata var. bicuspidata NRRL YB-4993]OBA21088.1 hypothetical protein METBIDRAFT_31699 [Metschnikowia bicuspidata var. bicuspidata NRRL YB-4993]